MSKFTEMFLWNDIFSFCFMFDPFRKILFWICESLIMRFQRKWAKAYCAMPEVPDLLFPRKKNYLRFLGKMWACIQSGLSLFYIFKQQTQINRWVYIQTNFMSYIWFLKTIFCIHSFTRKRHKRTSAKIVKLSMFSLFFEKVWQKIENLKKTNSWRSTEV